MAEEDNTTGIGIADPPNGAGEEPSAEGKFKPIAGKPLVVRFGEPIKGIGAVINRLLVDNFPVESLSAEIQEGSFIRLEGRDLGVFDDSEWFLERQGKLPVKLPVITGGQVSDSKLGGNWVELRVPTVAFSGLNSNESLGLSFFSSRFGGLRRILPVVFIFAREETANQKILNKNQPSTSKQQTVQGGQSGASVQGSDGIISTPLRSKIVSKPEIKQTVRAEKVNADLDMGEGGSLEESVEISGTGGQTSILPESRTEVTGQVSSTVQTGGQSIGGGGTAQINSQISGQSTVRQNVSVDQSSTTEAKGSQTISAQRTGEVQSLKAVGANQRTQSADLSASVEAQASATAQSSLKTGNETQVSRKGSVSAASPAKINLRQSGELVGEYLEKNPEAIVNADTRAKILKAVASGNLDSLSLPEKQELINLSAEIAESEDVPEDTRAAFSAISNAARGEPEIPPEVAGEEGLAPDKAPLPEMQGVEVPLKPEVPVPPEYQEKINQLKNRGKPLNLGASPERLFEEEKPEETRQSPVVPGQAALPDAEPEIGQAEPSEAEEAPNIPELQKPLPKGEIGPQAGTEGRQPPVVPRPEKKQFEGKNDKTQDQEPKLEQAESDQGAEKQAQPVQAARSGGALAGLAVAEGKKAAEEAANKALNVALLEASAWVWGGAFPTFGLSVLLGAIVGDAIWIFKNWALNKFIKNSPLARKFQQETKIDIKLSWAVKANIIAMNLVSAALFAILVLAIITFIWGICNSWITSTSAKALGMESICSSVNGLANYSSSAGSSIPPPSAPPAPTGGLCSPALTGPATPQALAGTCLASNAIAFSILANIESGGGNPRSESRTDMCKDGNSFSIGLYQINIIAHGQRLGPACAKNNLFQITGNGTAQGNCLQRNAAGVCLRYDCQVVNLEQYNTCKEMLKTPALNINIACQLSGNGANLQPWAYSKNRCGL